jgi:hypothetical protein
LEALRVIDYEVTQSVELLRGVDFRMITANPFSAATFCRPAQ